MLPWFRKKRKKAQTDEEILAEAFEEIGKQQTTRARRKRRALFWRKYADPRILVVLAIIVVVIIADGVRRENMEFYATVTEVTGSGAARLARDAMPEALEVGQRLEDGGQVVTRANCWVTLDFPDGSVITVAPNSQLTVELLEYNRAGMWRGRAFSLGVGHMWARISPKFGSNSRCRLHTPSSVAAVRGTRFYMGYDAEARETQISCRDGAVRVDGFRGRPTQVGGGATTSVSYGNAPTRQQVMDRQTATTFAQQPALDREIHRDPWLKRMEMRLTNILDLPLSVLGIGKSSWALLAADAARRTAAIKALQTIHTSIEGYPSYPEFVDPFTLRELDFRRQDALRVLRNFDGHAIEKYQRSGQGFVIWARARDKNRTPFMLNAYGVQQITEEEMPGL